MKSAHLIAILVAASLAGCDCKQELIDRVGKQNTDLILRQLLRQVDKLGAWGECSGQSLPHNVAECQAKTEQDIMFSTQLVCPTTKIRKNTATPAGSQLVSSTSLEFDVPGVVKGTVAGSVYREWASYCGYDVDHQHTGSGSASKVDPEFAVRNVVSGSLKLTLKASASGSLRLFKVPTDETISVSSDATCEFKEADFVGCEYEEDGAGCGSQHDGVTVWIDPVTGRMIRPKGIGWEEYDPERKTWHPVAAGSGSGGGVREPNGSGSGSG
jgi:hypothetical protein